MRYEHLPRQDKIAIEWYIDCLKKIADISIDYEIYESPSLYIIYLDDNVFDMLEDKIDEILDYNHKILIIDKEILFAPKRFMVSCEKKIEGWLDGVSQNNIEIKSSFYESSYSYYNYIQDIKNMNMPNNSSTGRYEITNQEQGARNGCKAA